MNTEMKEKIRVMVNFMEDGEENTRIEEGIEDLAKYMETISCNVTRIKNLNTNETLLRRTFNW